MHFFLSCTELKEVLEGRHDACVLWRAEPLRTQAASPSLLFTVLACRR